MLPAGILCCPDEAVADFVVVVGGGLAAREVVAVAVDKVALELGVVLVDIDSDA